MSSFSPLDMLDMQDSEQEILRSLNRKPGMTAPQIASSIGLSLQEVEAALLQMIGRSQVVEQQLEGQRTFSVQFGALQSRAVNVSSSLLDILEEPRG